jgi:hypothetical protein
MMRRENIQKNAQVGAEVPSSEIKRTGFLFSSALVLLVEDAVVVLVTRD